MVSTKIILVIFLLMVSTATALQPALPTQFYGKTTYTNGTVAPGIEVSAIWIDNNGVKRTTETTSLTRSMAQALNNEDLVGYYFFNKGYVQAADGTIITITSEKSINNQEIAAMPGKFYGQVADLTYVDTTDKTPPTISNVRITQFGIISVLFDTNEISRTSVRYGKDSLSNSNENSTPSTSHVIEFIDLEENSDYIYEVVAVDLAGNIAVDNNNGEYYSFSTGDSFYIGEGTLPDGSATVSDDEYYATGSQGGEYGDASEFAPTPNSDDGFPSSVYGQLTDEQGSPLEGEEVRASWAEPNGNKELSTKTLTQEQAESLGEPDLTGFYFFNENLTVPPGTQINITSDANPDYQAIAHTQPGDSVESRKITKTLYSPPKNTPAKVEQQFDNEPKAQLNITTIAKDAQNLFPLLIIIAILLISAILGLFFRKYMSKDENLIKNIGGMVLRMRNNSKTLFSTNIIKVNAKMMLGDVAKFMVDNNYSGAVVEKAGKTIGLVTEASITEDFYLKNKNSETLLENSTILPFTPIDPEKPVYEIYQAIKKSPAKKVVWLDNDRVRGIVTITDISNMIAQKNDANKIKVKNDFIVGSVMHIDLIKVLNTQTLVEVKQQMKAIGRDYVIVDSAKPLIITEQDLLRQITINGNGARKTNATHCAKVLSEDISKYMSLIDANKQMLDGFSRRPILAKNQLLGIVTKQDVVEEILKKINLQ